MRLSYFVVEDAVEEAKQMASDMAEEVKEEVITAAEEKMAEEGEALEARDLIQVRLARAPDFLEARFEAGGDPETVHGDEHGFLLLVCFFIWI